jgi:hypothetical protein
MKRRRLLRRLVLAIAAAVPPLAAAADQSAQMTGGHEIPAFIRERVELTPGTFDNGESPHSGAPSDAAARPARFSEGVAAR